MSTETAPTAFTAESAKKRVLATAAETAKKRARISKFGKSVNSLLLGKSVKSLLLVLLAAETI